MLSAEGTAVGRTLTLVRRFIVLPKTDSKGDRLVESSGAALIAVEHEGGGESTWYLWD